MFQFFHILLNKILYKDIIVKLSACFGSYAQPYREELQRRLYICFSCLLLSRNSKKGWHMHRWSNNQQRCSDFSLLCTSSSYFSVCDKLSSIFACSQKTIILAFFGLSEISSWSEKCAGSDQREEATSSCKREKEATIKEEPKSGRYTSAHATLCLVMHARFKPFVYEITRIVLNQAW